MSENKKIEYGIPWKGYNSVLQYNFSKRILIVRKLNYIPKNSAGCVAVWKLKSLKK